MEGEVELRESARKVQSNEEARQHRSTMGRATERQKFEIQLDAHEGTIEINDETRRDEKRRERRRETEGRSVHLHGESRGELKGAGK